MTLRILARLFFGLALAAQVLSPLSVGVAAAGTHAGPLGPLCSTLHEAAEALATDGAASKQAPKNDVGRHHGACAFCQMGSGEPALHFRFDVDPLAAFGRARQIFAGPSDAIVAFRGNRNAPARAPPFA
jgi:hypothetical protein